MDSESKNINENNNLSLDEVTGGEDMIIEKTWPFMIKESFATALPAGKYCHSCATVSKYYSIYPYTIVYYISGLVLHQLASLVQQPELLLGLQRLGEIRDSLCMVLSCLPAGIRISPPPAYANDGTERGQLTAVIQMA